MPAPSLTKDPGGRRRALILLVNGSVALIGGAFSALLGAFALRPAGAATAKRWITAAPLGDLTPGVPVPRVLSFSRVDGWYRARTRETVFLIWDGDRTVRALSATCTHLGCQVRWDGSKKHFQCPCHGGTYDPTGQVVAGPPPRPLGTLETRVDASGQSVLVRL